MRTNGRPQVYPFLRIAVMLALGIWAGFALHDGLIGIAGNTLIVAGGCLATASAIAVFACWRWPVPQSVAILVAVFSLGLWWAVVYGVRHKVQLPAGYYDYHAVVVSRPTHSGPDTLRCDMLIVGGQLDGCRLRAKFPRCGRDLTLRVGDGMEVWSRLYAPQNWSRNLPDVNRRAARFDYKRWMRVHGFVANTSIYEGMWRRQVIDLSGCRLADRMQINAMRLRDKLLQRLSDSGVGGQSFAVAAAMTLGDKSELTSQLREVYSVSGASHLLALSGLHLGIIYMLLSIIFLRRRRWVMVGQAITILAIWFYVVLVGMSPSVVRAAVMVTIYALAVMLGREQISLNALSLTAVVMLAANPLTLYDAGFQMSFLAVYSIIVCYRPIYTLANERWLLEHRAWRWLWSTVVVSVSAQICVAPLVAYYFGRFSCYFILTNIVAVVLTTAIIYVSLSLFVCAALPFAARGVAWVLDILVHVLNGALEAIASLPGASIDGIKLNIVQLALIYVIIACVYRLGYYVRKMYRSARGAAGLPVKWHGNGLDF